MNQTPVKAILLLIVFTLSCHTRLFSQRDFERHEFSFHAGYGVMFHNPPTLTLSTHSYQRWQIRVTTGPGGVILRNNSEVFGNTRKVRAFTIGLLTNANLTYKLNSNLGVSLGVQYMYSELLRMRTYYHEEKVTVKLNSNDDVNLTRLNITTGLSYYF